MESLLVEVPVGEVPAVDTVGQHWTPAGGDLPHASFTFDSRQRVYERRHADERAHRSRVLPIVVVLILALAGLTAAWTYREEIAQGAGMLLMRNAQGEGKTGNHATVNAGGYARLERS